MLCNEEGREEPGVFTYTVCPDAYIQRQFLLVASSVRKCFMKGKHLQYLMGHVIFY